jgi:HlyD family secretion protein
MNKMIEFIKTKYKTILIVLGILFLLGLCFFSLSGSGKDEPLTEHTIARNKVVASINATGNLTGKETRNLTFVAGGIVDKVYVESGAEVKQNDPIASLDKLPFEAQLRMAQGDLQATNANLSKVKDRSQITLQEKSLEIVKLDNELAQNQYSRDIQIADNNLDKASLQLDMAETNLDYAEDIESAQILIVSDASVDLQATMGPESENLAIEQRELTSIQQDKNLEIQQILTDQASLDYHNANLSTKNTKDTIETSLDKLQKQMEIAQIQLGQVQTSNQADINSVSGQLARAQGSLDLARYNLEKSTIVAPFDGVVLNIPFKQGEQYIPSGPTNSILFADLDTWKVVVNVNELDIGLIKIGQKAIIEVDGLFGTTFEGKVNKINYGPTGTEGLVSYKVEIEFSKPEENVLYLGMTASVDFVTEEKENVITVPLVAIQSKGDKKLVNVKKDGKIVETQIEIGLQGESEVEVLSGLNEGDVVVY